MVSYGSNYRANYAIRINALTIFIFYEFTDGCFGLQKETVNNLTNQKWGHAEAALGRFCFLIFSTRVVLLMFSSFAALVLTPALFSRASRISFLS